MTEIIRICIECGRNASTKWWKCCPHHTSEQGLDVVCQSCFEIMHPDREPQPGDGPDYHNDHAAWKERQKGE